MLQWNILLAVKRQINVTSDVTLI